MAHRDYGRRGEFQVKLITSRAVVGEVEMFGELLQFVREVNDMEFPLTSRVQLIANREGDIGITVSEVTEDDGEDSPDPQ